MSNLLLINIFFAIISVVKNMNIVYRKNTLYVYLYEEIDSNLVDTIENRVNNIMGTYDIENLVIKTNGQYGTHFLEFENRYNSRHKSKVIIQ